MVFQSLFSCCYLICLARLRQVRPPVPPGFILQYFLTQHSGGLNLPTGIKNSIFMFCAIRSLFPCMVTYVSNCVYVSNWRTRKRARHYQGYQMESELYLYMLYINVVYIYNIYIMLHARHFSSVGLVVHNVGGIKCQPFLERNNHWKATLINMF